MMTQNELLRRRRQMNRRIRTILAQRRLAAATEPATAADRIAAEQGAGRDGQAGTRPAGGTGTGEPPAAGPG